MNNSTEWVVRRLLASPGTLAAVSAALWGLVGRPVTLDNLQWSRRLLGDEGPLMLLNALRATGTLQCTPPLIRPPALASVLAAWAGEAPQPSLAVTLPSWVSPGVPELPTTRDVLSRLIAAATTEVLICTPYVDREGIGLLIEPLREATGRGVQVTVATHHLDDPQSPNARAGQALRAEAPAAVGVHLPSLRHNVDGVSEPLLVHAKLVIVDSRTALIGSANLTRAGLTGNVEVGMVVHGLAVEQALSVWRMVIAKASRSTG